MSGTLFVCGTPIGNLEDITLRQLRVLKEVDLIACEDTRHTLKLLSHYDIHQKLTSYHEHNEREKGAYLLSLLKEGKDIALVSDAGMPGISDPGQVLITLCHENDIKVTCVPGPTAAATAVVLSGLSRSGYVFAGFFPRERKAQEQILKRLEEERLTTVFYEAPHRLSKTLELFRERLGGGRKVSCVKELTKKHEQVMALSLAEMSGYYEANEPKGEYVLLVAGIDEKELLRKSREDFEALDISAHMALYINQGMEKKEAMKQVAKDRGIAKREVYAALLDGGGEV